MEGSGGTVSLDKIDLPEHHLKYEVDMLLQLAKAFSNNQIKVGDIGTDIVKNAFLESYLVHVRNIKDFLWKCHIKNDISAKQFCSQDCSRHSTVNKDKLAGLSVEEIGKRINKQISHLTSDRKTKTKEHQTWNTNKITCDLVCFLQEFISKADKIDSVYKKAIEDELNGFKTNYCLCNKLRTEESSSYSTTAYTSSISFPRTPLLIQFREI